MALESYKYRDPALVAEINEAREQRRNDCHPCIYKLRLWGVDCCTENSGVAGSRMKRCEKFNNGKGIADGNR